MQPRAQVGATPPQLENPDCTVQAEDQKLWCNKYVPGSVKRSKIHAKTAVQISEESYRSSSQVSYRHRKIKTSPSEWAVAWQWLFFTGSTGTRGNPFSLRVQIQL